MTNHSELVKLQNGDSPKIAVICKGMNKTQDAEKPLGERRKAVLRQELMVILGNLGVLGAGMAVAIPSVTLANLTNPAEQFHLTTEEASWFSSINTMAFPLGGLLVGYLMDRIGRKNTILATNVLGVISWFLLAATPFHSDRESKIIQMLIARFLAGVMIGLYVSPVGVYSAEISLPKIRGRLILGTSVGLAAGILFMYVLGYFIREDWRLITTISGVYQIFTTICVLPMPESPSWLMQHGQVEKARKALLYFRGLDRNDGVACCDEFETELSQIKKTADISRNSAATESLLQAIKTPEVYKPLLLMIGFFGFQQGSGVVVVVVFSVQIAMRAGVSIDPVLCAVLVGVARIITTCFMGTIFERWGRRPAGILSASGMTVCMLLLAAGGWCPELGTHVPLLPVICIVLHIVFSTMGLLTLPFFMISEVFPQRVRGSASGITLCFGLLISFVVIKLYPTMEMHMGTANVFFFYGCMSLLAVIFIYFLVPETRGRTLLEIEEHFRMGRSARSMSKPKKAESSANEADYAETDVELQQVFLKN